MNRHDGRRRIALALLVTVLLVPTGIGATPADELDPVPAEPAPEPAPELATEATAFNHSMGDDPPETADEFLTAFRALNGSEAFLEYSELEVVRSQAVTEVQVGDFSREKHMRIALLYEVLWTFNRSYVAAEAGDADEALQWANESDAAIESLRNEGDTEYAALSGLAVDRFYRDFGDRSFDQARTTDHTPTEIRSLSVAAVAYRRAGAAEEYSQVTVRLDAVQTRFESDLETMNTSVAQGEAYLAGCTGCSSLDGALANGPVVFREYRTASNVRSEVSHAETLAQRHGLDARQESIGALRSDLSAAIIALRVASSILALAYLAIVTGLTVVVLRQLFAWERDVNASRRVELLFRGEVA